MEKQNKNELKNETPVEQNDSSLRGDFNRRFLEISNGREKTVIALMFLSMVIGFVLVLYSRNKKLEEPQESLLEIIHSDTKEVREAVPFSIIKPPGTAPKLLEEYEVMLTEYESLLKMENVDSVKLREIEYELNKMLQNVKN